MKLILLFIFYVSQSFAGIDNCLKDALKAGNNLQTIVPSESCSESVKNHPNSFHVYSNSRKYHFFAYDHLAYIEQEENGVSTTQILTGEETELKKVKIAQIDELNRRIIITQRDSISIFDLDFLGNVSPLNKYISNYLSSSIGTILLKDEKLLAIFQRNGFRLINSDAESRYETPHSKPKIIFEFKDDDLTLQEVKSALYLKDKNIAVVLNGNSVLVFAKNKTTQSFKVENAKALKIKDGEIFVIKTNEEFLKIPVVY